jgi:hypothetical protein
LTTIPGFIVASNIKRKEAALSTLSMIFLEIVKLAKAQTHQNRVLFPLLAPEPRDPDYLTLEEALRVEAVIITEVGEGGHVPELKLINRSESRILVLDGGKLKQAKQN